MLYLKQRSTRPAVLVQQRAKLRRQLAAAQCSEANPCFAFSKQCWQVSTHAQLLAESSWSVSRDVEVRVTADAHSELISRLRRIKEGIWAGIPSLHYMQFCIVGGTGEALCEEEAQAQPCPACSLVYSGLAWCSIVIVPARPQ